MTTATSEDDYFWVDRTAPAACRCLLVVPKILKLYHAPRSKWQREVLFFHDESPLARGPQYNCFSRNTPDGSFCVAKGLG